MAKISKCCTWILRIFQHITALVVLGVSAYMVDQFHKYGDFGIPQECFVPLLFSIIALFVTTWSLIAICCLSVHLQILAALLDFIVLSGFVASAVILHANYHSDNRLNPLRNWLIIVRYRAGEESLRISRSGALVKLLDAGVIILIFLFFFTTLLCFRIAVQDYRKEQDVYQGREGPRHRDVEVGTTTDESSYFTDTDATPSHTYRDRRR
ncbi:hypothetical protein EX30DRAFT_245186 [Ascodesmis nigricans]|uniref:MARVEL domain-containing protein n=1 Tax=Ascodesmis nigricans TaxID=341454 RepID=A0A4S2MIE0_9PEZI|nr:hypothetical protein EX30DRAFT_245186 [Ascodesmis nigricans]